jgi:hypothetical protein
MIALYPSEGIIVKTKDGYIAFAFLRKGDYEVIQKGRKGYSYVQENTVRHERVSELSFLTIEEFEMLIGFE